MARENHLVISENGGTWWLHWDIRVGGSKWFPNYTLLFIHKQTQAFPSETKHCFTSCGPGPLSDL